MIFDDSAPRVFCLSIQRTGTTSVGRFFRDFGYSWAGWPTDCENAWSEAWYRGDYERIFSSPDFRSANAFEDSPWFFPEFYKILYHRFPNSRFILLTRNPDAWFQSMLSHSSGNVIGRSEIHCKLYRREADYLALTLSADFQEFAENRLEPPKTLQITGHDEHYKSLYTRQNREVVQFFSKYAPQSFFTTSLEDSMKWLKLGKFLNIQIPPDYQAHENSSASNSSSKVPIVTATTIRAAPFSKS